MGDAHEPERDDEESDDEEPNDEDRDEDTLLNTEHIIVLIIADIIIVPLWAAGLVVAHNVAEHVRFLGLEQLPLQVWTIASAIIIGLANLMIALDDLDVLWMRLRTRRFLRREQYREITQRRRVGPRPPDDPRTPLPPPDEEANTSA